MQKKNIPFATIALVALLAIMIQPVSAELITAGDAIDATLLYYQPVPAQAGDLIDVYIQVENNGGKPSNPGTLTIFDSGPFKVESERERTKQFPSIPSQETFLIKTKVRIAKDANEGENELRIRVQESNSVDWIDRNLAISITGRSSALSIVSAQTTPAAIMPGEESALAIKVTNVGETKVRNVDIALDFTDLSLAPLGGSDSKTIEMLKGGESYTFMFNIISYPDAIPQAYRIPVTLSYDDETGNEKSQSEQIGVVIDAKPELLVYFDSTTMTQEQKSGEAVIRFVNKGLSEIKLLEMEVIEDDTVSVTGESPVVYVGNIDEDDYESANIMLSVTENDVEVPLRISYRDALNREYTENVVLNLSLQSGNGNGSRTSPIVWLVIIVIVVGGVFWWRSNIAKKRRRK